MLDHEVMFRLMKDNQWDELSELIFDNKSLMKTDPLLSHAIKLFESEFFRDITSFSAVDRLNKLRNVSLIIESKRDGFSQDFVNKAIDYKLIALKETNDRGLTNYASTYMDRPLALEILKEMKSEKPEVFAQAKRTATHVNARSTKEKTGRTLKLFKSPQEENFFNALKIVFPQYYAYPNVAMSCVIDFEAVEKKLTQEQKGYFYKSVIDFVIFDPQQGFEPINFFELDSSFHDTDKAKHNDQLKDSIFAAADVKLVRIRAYNQKETTVDEFKTLVLDLMS